MLGAVGWQRSAWASCKADWSRRERETDRHRSRKAGLSGPGGAGVVTTSCAAAQSSAVDGWGGKVSSAGAASLQGGSPQACRKLSPRLFLCIPSTFPQGPEGALPIPMGLKPWRRCQTSQRIITEELFKTYVLLLYQVRVRCAAVGARGNSGGSVPSSHRSMGSWAPTQVTRLALLSCYLLGPAGILRSPEE